MCDILEPDAGVETAKRLRDIEATLVCLREIADVFGYGACWRRNTLCVLKHTARLLENLAREPGDATRDSTLLLQGLLIECNRLIAELNPGSQPQAA